MRVILAIFAALAAFAAVSVEAGPNSANWVDLGITAPLDLVAQSCAPDWLRSRWRDHWGYWHGGHCIPARGGAAGVGDRPQGWTALGDQAPGSAVVSQASRLSLSFSQ